MSDRQTHFGFQTVDEDAKAGMVHGVFSRVASRYDVMNDLMSVGIHRIWKNAMMDWLAPRDGQQLLDVAGGTGDIAFRFLDRAPKARVTVCDMTKSMLVEGRKRAEAEALADRLSWVTGDAMALPFADDSFDRYTISFGIRNVTRIPDALAEAFRVLRPGGRLMVLEFSQLPVPAMQWAYDRYSFNVIPALGQMVANDRDSYQYLVEIDPPLPRSGHLRRPDPRCRVRAGAISQPLHGHRRAAFGLEAVTCAARTISGA